VLIGYVHGVAVVLIIGQLGKLLGLSINAQNPLGKLVEDIKEITDLSWITLAVGLASLAAQLLLGWLFPKLPGPLIVVVLGHCDIGRYWAGRQRRRSGGADSCRLAQPRSP
jgi:sulfate permease, SulP family